MQYFISNSVKNHKYHKCFLAQISSDDQLRQHMCIINSKHLVQVMNAFYRQCNQQS